MDTSVFSKSRFDSLKMASKNVAGQRGVSNDVRFAFDAIMQVICKRQWYGACHATSAMLFMALKEKGHTPRLHLGQCKGDRFFDHSWVTIDGKIYDAAIAFNLAEKQYGGPVFDGIDLDTLADATMLYGNSSLPFDVETQIPAKVSISEYMDGGDVMWQLLHIIFDRVGIPFEESSIREKYLAARWEIEPVKWVVEGVGV